MTDESLNKEAYWPCDRTRQNGNFGVILKCLQNLPIIIIFDCSTLWHTLQGVRNRGSLGARAPPIFWKKCEQISEKGDFEIFITLLGPSQYSSCCARPASHSIHLGWDLVH